MDLAPTSATSTNSASSAAAGITDDEFAIAFDGQGLAPCVVQHAETGTILMLAWMNQDALTLTRSTNIVHFWSRSRQALWKKGETSGNLLHLVELRTDCDRDALVARVRPHGPACHTGTASCFFVVDHGPNDDGVPALLSSEPTNSAHMLDRLATVITDRRDRATCEKSYTKSLLDAGMPKILAKIAEEQSELAAELPSGSDARVVSETADLMFHILVGLAARHIEPSAVWAELARRFGISGLTEKASRTP
ncbi:MAG: bifunctional phosphoribosyl-AMP cyclohydrolase/phosphoribosyl-ATP diphosphatase HisIE [Kofleriaceae bacterium]|nr:bifunctional phosphoribosyl-AMP cyclohydrolase/phosphoribosyl-ATP diphosphatase HisIE [Kofleriaceae bacterium]